MFKDSFIIFSRLRFNSAIWWLLVIHFIKCVRDILNAIGDRSKILNYIMKRTIINIIVIILNDKIVNGICY